MVRRALVIAGLGLAAALQPSGSLHANQTPPEARETHTIAFRPDPKPLQASRASRQRHSAPPLPWSQTAKAVRVAKCESGGNPKAVSPTGKYRGKWQMNASFWRTYGGLAFAARPDGATEHEQDIVAYRGWKARGWQPWTCGY